jgi:phospholipid/cholesterol/gamma-HCH transport system substrate-binding protein
MNRALAVGVFAAVTGIALLVALTFFRKGGYSNRDSYLVYAHFRDATGLTWKSRVQIAGIEVGEVVDITLSGGRARLDIRVRKDVPLHTDACVTKTFPSALLPDAVLETYAGTDAAPLLESLPEEQREIACVRSAASAQELMDSMAKIAADVSAVTGDLAKSVSGNQGSLSEIIANLARITRQVDEVVTQNGETLSGILANTRQFTGDLSEISSRDKERIHNIARNIEELTTQLRVVVASVQEIMDPAAGAPRAPGGDAAAPGSDSALPPGEREKVVADARGMRVAVDRLSGSLTKLDDMLSTVSEGKSVAGKLLVDERLGRQLGNAVEGVSDYVDRLTKLQVQLQLRSEWLLNQTLQNEGRPGTKIYFSARLLPRPDKYYLLELVSDPRGVDSITSETVDTATPTGTVRTVTTKKVNEDKLTFSFQLAKRYGPTTFRIGIIEGSGGAGADLHLLKDSLQLSASLYQFSRAFQDPARDADRAVYPRAKIWVNYYFMQHFFFTTGVDDFLNQWETGRYPGGRNFNIGADLFFGGGLFFTDDDLKTLLGTGLGSAAGAMP